jgi:hypothetical protein
MNLVFVALSDDPTSREVREHLAASGHAVHDPRDGGSRDIGQDDVVIVYASSGVEAEAVPDATRILGQADRASARVIGLTDLPETSPAVAETLAVPVRWFSLTRVGIDEVLAMPDAPPSTETPSGAKRGKVIQVDMGELRNRIRSSLSDAPASPRSGLPRIFVSYSSRDDRAATSLINELRHLGYDVWVDKSNIPGGGLWRAKIEEGITQSDVVLLLLSPNVADHPEWVQAELTVAQTAGKRIVPVELESVTALPPGFGLIISGRQAIKLYRDYESEFARLLSTLGGSVEPGRRSVVGKVKNATARARRFAKKHQLGQKAVIIGGALAAGMAAASSASDNREAQRRRDERQRQDDAQLSARMRYGDETISLLDAGLAEMARTRDVLLESGEIDVVEFRRDVKPRLTRIIGRLEGGEPVAENRDLADYHRKLVQSLDGMVDEFERLLEKRDNGDAIGFNNAVRRLNDEWTRVLQSGISWARTLSENA